MDGRTNERTDGRTEVRKYESTEVRKCGPRLLCVSLLDLRDGTGAMMTEKRDDTQLVTSVVLLGCW